jgi:hypothetical protein
MAHGSATTNDDNCPKPNFASFSFVSQLRHRNGSPGTKKYTFQYGKVCLQQTGHFRRSVIRDGKNGVDFSLGGL